MDDQHSDILAREATRPTGRRSSRRDAGDSSPSRASAETRPGAARGCGGPVAGAAGGAIVAAAVCICRGSRTSATRAAARAISAGRRRSAPRPAQKGDMPVTLSGLGTVTPLATVTVQTQINGYLMAVGFQEGQHVKKGDFLAQIDPRPYQVALEQAQAPARQGPGGAEGRRARPQALQHARRAEFDRDADARHPDRDRRPGSGAGHAGPGPDRHAKAQPDLLPTSFRRSPAGSGCARSTPATTCRPATPTASSS